MERLRRKTSYLKNKDNMEVFNQIIHNSCIMIPVILWCVVQLSKFFTELIIHKKVNFKRLVGAGGMPSSHSAIVCCLASCLGKTYGFDSGIFSLSLIFAFVVMYDAAGVRRAAGKQAGILNKILDTPGMSTLEVQEKLIEALGHTPIQVFVGAIIGFVVGAIV